MKKRPAAEDGRTLNSLKSKILEANNLYRVGRPIMSDQEFDDLCDAAQGLMAAEDWNAFRDSLHEAAGKVRHPFVMGSLDKLKYEDGQTALAKFFADNHVTTLNVSRKVDGISCRLHYSAEGRLVSASTRGDGYRGEDLTDKIVHVQSVPASIRNTMRRELDIRGELVILRPDFNRISGEYSNPRNACAGIMNRKDWTPAEVAHVSFIAYTILGSEFPKKEQLLGLGKLGFRVTEWFEFRKREFEDDGFADRLYRIADDGTKAEYETDGLVLCDNAYLNEDEYRPNAQVAFKINQMQAATQLREISWEGPSKDGTMAPVALLEPVELGGAMIGRATLHNLDFIEKHGIMPGCTLSILKSGDVIPNVLGVVSAAGAVPAEYPTVCPACGAKLVRIGVDLRCMNPDCGGRHIAVTAAFIRKLGVKNVSETSLRNFGIMTYGDLLEFVPVRKYKVQTKFYDDLLEKVFGASRVQLLCATNFRDFAETNLMKIVNHYGEGWVFDRNRKKDVKPLPFGIGAITMDKFLEALDANLDIVARFVGDSRYHGQSTGAQETTPREVVGSVCFTGALATMSRAEAARKAREAGYEVKSGVANGLTYLVTNDTGSGSGKNRKAAQLGIAIIDEKAFLELVK